jgi:hypothetical protein
VQYLWAVTPHPINHWPSSTDTTHPLKEAA